MSNAKTRIQKGKDLENFVAQKLRDAGIDNNAKRQIGSGNGKFKGDISTTIPWCIECKNSKTFNWKSTAEQVEREAMGHEKEVIIWHPPQKPLDNSIAIININDFIDLLKKNQEPKIKEPDSSMKWALTKLKTSINAVLKEL